jgi:hypothetical protein
MTKAAAAPQRGACSTTCTRGCTTRRRRARCYRRRRVGADTRTVRQRVIDHLVDTVEAGPQSVAQILEGTGLNRSACEQALHRAIASLQILRLATGIYKIAPPKPKPPPEPPRVRSDGTTDEQWLSWLFERRETGVWRGPGPPPGDPGRMVPMDITWKFSARVEQREKERQRPHVCHRDLRGRLPATSPANRTSRGQQDRYDQALRNRTKRPGAESDVSISCLRASQRAMTDWVIDGRGEHVRSSTLPQRNRRSPEVRPRLCSETTVFLTLPL